MRTQMENAERITVQVLKYDGTEHRRWSARVSQREGPLIILDAEFDEDVEHDVLGSISCGTQTIEYYWLDRWYNIFRFLDHKGETRLWYCNVNTPPSITDHMLTYIDLDIDVLVQPDFSYAVLDLDDFEDNAKRFSYSDDTRRQALDALKELQEMITGRYFPFGDRSAEIAGTIRTQCLR